jgi:hypothetical protein
MPASCECIHGADTVALADQAQPMVISQASLDLVTPGYTRLRIALSIYMLCSSMEQLRVAQYCCIWC